MPIRKQITGGEIEEMNKELESLERAFDVLDVHIVITDVHGNIIYANPAAQKITGYSLEEMLGRNPGDLWGGFEDNQFFAQMWKTIKEDKRVFNGRVHNKNKDGVGYVQELHITPLLGRDGEVKYFAAMEPDITLQASLENQIIENSKKFTDLKIMLTQQAQKIADLDKILKAILPR